MAADTTTELGPLTQGDALILGELLIWVREGRKVRYSTDGGETIRQGVLRHVVAGPQPHEWGFLRNDRDVRTGWVRITDTFESALPVSQILELIRDQLFFAEKR
jgi:hypothetical protein